MEGSTPPWIVTIESHLKCALPTDLRALYLRGDGEQCLTDARGFPSSDAPAMRLMSSAEVCEAHTSLDNHTRLRGSCPFWRDGQGSHDYAAMYLSGALTGRIYFWSYDGRCDSVAYRHVGSFLNAMRNAPDCAWYQLPTDYYVDSEYYLHGEAKPLAASEKELATDSLARDQLELDHRNARLEDELDEHHYAFNLLALTPPSDTNALLSFLESEDMWVQERACNILGNRKASWAISPLARVIQHGQQNGVTAALRALGNIGTDTARTAILESAKHLETGYCIYVAKALERSGCEIRREFDQHFYRLHGNSAWQRLELSND